jgi:hypothetical protein
VVCALALQHQEIPLTLNHQEPGLECDLDYVAGRSRPYPIRVALNLSSGFGGKNSCLCCAATQPDMVFGELIPLTGALLNFSLAVFVALQNPRAVVSRVYLLLGICFAVWNYGTFWMFRVRTHDEALFWARFLQFGVIFIPYALFHISFLVAQIRIPPLVTKIAYSLHALLFLTNFTEFFVADVKNVGYAWYAVAGPVFWIFVGVFSLMWVSVAVLLWHRRKLPPLGRRRITPLILAQCTIALFGCNDALPILGIYYYPGALCRSTPSAAWPLSSTE